MRKIKTKPKNKYKETGNKKLLMSIKEADDFIRSLNENVEDDKESIKNKNLDKNKNNFENKDNPILDMVEEEREPIRKCINEEAKAYDQIPLKIRAKKGHYRLKSKNKFKKEIYSKRTRN